MMHALVPVAFGDTGNASADLHRALEALGVDSFVTAEERAQQRYGDGTTNALACLQKRHHWPASEPSRVDKQCAARLNARLAALGLMTDGLTPASAEYGGRPQTHPEDTALPSLEAGAAQAVKLCLLPSFELTRDGVSVSLPSRAQRLIALLAISDRPLSRTVVAARLWPDVVNARSNASLRSTLWSLPRESPALVLADGNTLSLDPSVRIDLAEAYQFANSILEGRSQDKICCAESDLRDDLLPTWSDEWLAIERDRFRQARLHALDALCVMHAHAGRFARAIAAGLASASSEPTRESAHRALMIAHILEGNRMEAIRQYHAYLSIARAEMGIGPSDHLQQLFLTALKDAPVTAR